MDIYSIPPPEPTPGSSPARSSPLSCHESSPTSSPSRNSSSDVEETSATPPLRRSTRISKPNPQYADYNTSCTLALLVTDPISFDEAVNELEWCKAMGEELQAIKKNETWDLVELPEEKSVIGLKWVYRTKYHANGKIQKFKARLVAKGYVQQEGVDFDETFSPVAPLKQ